MNVAGTCWANAAAVRNCVLRRCSSARCSSSIGTTIVPSDLLVLSSSTTKTRTPPGLRLLSTTTTSTKSVKAKEEEEGGGGIGYLDRKKAAKERRRALWEARQERKERLKTRRSGKPRDEKRRAFRSFFIKKKVSEEYMNRKARQAGLDWKIYVSVILERINVVLPDKEDWEVEYENLLCHMSQFGIQYPKELVDFNFDQKIPTTDEELLALLPKGFTPAPRETEADQTGNVRTTDRKLKTSVYLVVQDEDSVKDSTDSTGSEMRWQLPTVALQEDELLLEAAKRAVVEKVGSNVEFWCPSNCPCAVDMIPFEEKDSGYYGVKKFFMKIQYDEGSVSEREMTVQDFAWLDRSEIVDLVQKEQGKDISKFYHYLL